MADKYVFYKVFDNQIVVMQDALGRVHYHIKCPCIVSGDFKYFIDLIQINPMFYGHDANFLPQTNSWYDVNYVFNWYTDYCYSTPLTMMFQQYDLLRFSVNSYQQTLALDDLNKCHVNLYKQMSRLIQKKVVSGTTSTGYQNIYHLNKLGPSGSMYNDIYFQVGLTDQFYTYLSSVSFNNTDYLVEYNKLNDDQKLMFGLSNDQYYSSDGEFYYIDDNDDFKPYSGACFDRKEYYITRVISGETNAYCFDGTSPDYVDEDDMSNLALDWKSIGGKSKGWKAGDYIVLSKRDPQGFYLYQQNQKYYYYDQNERLVHQYKGQIESCLIVPSTDPSYTSQYYTGLAFWFNDQTRYIYTKPSTIQIEGYNGGLLGVKSQTDKLEKGWYTDYWGSVHYPLQFDSTSGWFFATYISEYYPQDNTYVWLNDYTQSSPPLYWTENPDQEEPFYVHMGYYFRNDCQADPVDAGSGYYMTYNSYFYPLKYNFVSGYYIQTDQDNYFYLSDYDHLEDRPTYYYLTGEYPKVCLIGFSDLCYHYDNQYNLQLIMTSAYYDTRFGDLINTISPAPYNKDNFNSLNEQIYCPKCINRNLSPFILRKNYNYGWDYDDNNDYLSTLTMARFFTSTHLISKDVETRELPYYQHRDGGPAVIQFGEDDYVGWSMGIKTVLFTKADSQYIHDHWYSYYDDVMSTMLSDIKGVYCQILTGVWIKPYGVRNSDLEYNFRANGYFYQTLQLDKEYAFCPWFMKTPNPIDLLEQQEGWSDFLLRLKDKSYYYDNFYNNFYENKLLSSFKCNDPEQFGFYGVDYFQGAYYVRPISGVTTLDGSEQLNLAPAALTSQTIPEE